MLLTNFKVDGDEVNTLIGNSFEGGKLKVFRRGWHHVIAQTDFGLSIEFDGSWLGSVKIPSTLVNLTNGICGNHNNDPSDDLTTNSGHRMNDVANGQHLFGISWQVDDPDAPQ